MLSRIKIAELVIPLIVMEQSKTGFQVLQARLMKTKDHSGKQKINQ